MNGILIDAFETVNNYATNSLIKQTEDYLMSKGGEGGEKMKTAPLSGLTK